MTAREPRLVGVVWWPHSGGRWFCRTLLKRHPGVHAMVFAHPWFFVTTDMTLELDNTTQVHKARSLPEQEQHLRALVQSTTNGRTEGLRQYMAYARTEPERRGIAPAPTHVVGELCMGTPVPRAPDLASLFAACPDARIIHLIRNPVDCFPSFATRFELDSDPVKIAGSWLTANATVRTFFTEHPELAKQALTVRYEDLMTQLDTTLARVWDHLQLDRLDDPPQLEGERWGKQTDVAVEPRAAALIRSVAASELAFYGYT